MDEAQTGGTSEDVATHRIVPAEVANESREDEADEKDEAAVPTVLPPDNLVLAQVADVGNTELTARLDEHPTDVRPEEALVCVVGVECRIRIAMVRAVTTAPPLDGALDRTGACEGEEVLQRLRRVVSAVRP